MGSTAICDCVKLKICIFNNWSVEKNANADVTYESTLRPKGCRTAELKTPEVCCCSKPYNRIIPTRDSDGANCSDSIIIVFDEITRTFRNFNILIHFTGKTNETTSQRLQGDSQKKSASRSSFTRSATVTVVL